MKIEKRRMGWLTGALLLWLATAPLAQAFYNPTAGRWINRDPIQEAGGNALYALVGNDAVRKVDVLGLVGMGEYRKHCCGETWNPKTHCCDCKGRIVPNQPIPTGVQRANYQPQAGEPDSVGHQWVELYENASGGGGVINSPGFNLGNAGHWGADSPGFAGVTGAGFTRREVRLSPCDYDIEAFRSCIKNASPPSTAQQQQWMRTSSPCGSYVNWLVGTCEKQAIHECSSLKKK